MPLDILDRRRMRHPTMVHGKERRSDIAGHVVAVGPIITRPGWIGGACSCGQHAEARVEGVVEAWVVCHRAQVIMSRPLVPEH
ncbi:MAG: hypothetical protein ACYDD4_13910 [Acidimicrobiales bacterium]